MVWIPEDFPLELWFFANQFSFLSYSPGSFRGARHSTEMTTTAWLGQVTKFSVQFFSFHRHRYKNSDNKHSKIFMKDCNLDQFSLASLYRLHWARHKSLLRRLSNSNDQRRGQWWIKLLLILSQLSAWIFTTQYPLSVLLTWWYQLKGSLLCVVAASERLALSLYGMGKFLKSQKWSEEEIRAADAFLWSVLCQKDAV